MTTIREKKDDLIETGPHFLPVVVLGLMVGYLFAGDILNSSGHELASALSMGLVCSYLFMQWVEIAADFIALARNPIPISLDVADREAVREHLDRLTGRQAVTLRAKRLLRCWSAGSEARQVIDLAAYESAHLANPFRYGIVFVLLLAIVLLPLNGNDNFVYGSVVVLALTVLGRQNLATRINHYLDGRLLSRLPGNIGGTSLTANDLAEALGSSIERAFQHHVPQPGQTADAIRGAVEGVVRQVAQEVAGMEKKMAEGRAELIDKMMGTVTSASAGLKEVETALATVCDKLEKALNGHAQDIEKVMSESTGRMQTDFGSTFAELKEALASHAAQIGQAGGNWGGQIGEALSAQSDKLTSAAEALAAQLQKIAQLQEGIENILHVQQAVDESMKAVASNQEFIDTLSALRRHVEESDKLLREVARPRTIRLVESDLEYETT